jgi:hypothetical protein
MNHVIWGGAWLDIQTLICPLWHMMITPWKKKLLRIILTCLQICKRIQIVNKNDGKNYLLKNTK